MTENNRNFSWKELRNEELGLGLGRQANSHETRHRGEISPNLPLNYHDDSVPPTVNSRIDANRRYNSGEIGRYENTSELTNYRLLANANDEFYVSDNDDNPGMILTADLFDGRNFHSWIHSVRKRLVAMNKLGFVDGRITQPMENSVDYWKWIKVDCLVFTWISNSIVKELSRGFQHLDTAKQLWDELNRGFGERNGHSLYKLRREIASCIQGNDSVLTYFNNLSALWEELRLFKNRRPCICAAAGDAREDKEIKRMMQFLMGLNESYDQIRSQILLMEPLPDVYQAYGMVMQVEEMYSNQKGNTRGEGFRRRLSKEEKMKLKCNHCGGNGHEKMDCFELTGVPEWYKEFKSENKGRARRDSESDISKLIQTGIAKYLSHYMQRANLAEGNRADNSKNLVKLAEDVDTMEYTEHYVFGSSCTFTT